MPAKSKKQERFLQAVAHGGIKAPGLTKESAAEYVSHNTGDMAYDKLPEQVKKKKARKSALKKMAGY